VPNGNTEHRKEPLSARDERLSIADIEQHLEQPDSPGFFDALRTFVTSGPTENGLTPRERWQRCFHYQPVDRVPHYEFGYWKELYDEWHAQGLPATIRTELALDTYFGLDRRCTYSPRQDLWPPFEEEVLEDRGDRQIIRDEEGVICEVRKDGSSIPHYLEFPIKGRDDWERFKERLDPTDPTRQPVTDLQRFAEIVRQATIPVGIGIGSLFGRLRNWTGFERICMLLYDDPDLIEEMVETMCQIILTTIEPVLQVARFDYAAGWEDIAFNQGPMLSPTMFRRLLVPRYRRIADLLHQYGVDVIYVDCDGNINAIAGLWLEAGYNCMFPIEVRAGTDPVALRERFGREMLLLGGFDKMVLLDGPEAILAELKRLEPIVRDGGFVPHVDHRVPAGVPLSNFLYYQREKRALLGFSADQLEVPARVDEM